MSNLLAESAAAKVAEHIAQLTGKPFQMTSQQTIGGGCINQAAAISDGQRTFFIKVNKASELAMFEAECEGLKAMHNSGTIRVPKPLGTGIAGSIAYIVMEYLPLGGRSSTAAWQQMGQQLAAMHQTISPEGFGWHRDNTIGATLQLNGWGDEWSAFWRDRRLGPQFSMAHARGGHFPRRDELMSALPRLLAGHTPQPALLHGDLWSGNAAVTDSGEPVILDPATYYGDPETDLAMTELFGRFPDSFYQAYNAASPIDSGYRHRKVLYNLYHILNHFNLFGGGYASQANSMIEEILG